MRADRLLALMLLLQTRGKMTASQLANELEVSVRTIYRDIEALSAAGVPVYCEWGPGGGCALLDSFRTNFTGLTESELRALFILSIPQPLADLGLTADLQAALLKLSVALPTSKRQAETYVRQRVHLDPVGWFQRVEDVPCLTSLQQAVWQDRCLHIRYRAAFGAEFLQQVAPYGLVAKASVWYLVYARNGRIRVMRAAHILEAALSEEIFTRPDDFDLAAFWQEWCCAYEKSRRLYPVTLRITPDFVPTLAHHLHCQPGELYASGTTDTAGRLTLLLPYESLEDARQQILAWGRGVEVLAPQALRISVFDFAQQIIHLYG